MHCSALYRVLLFVVAPATLLAQQPVPGPSILPERVAPAASPLIKKDERVTQIVPLRYIEVADLVEHLRPLLAQTIILSADERSNSIILTDTQSNVRRTAQIITLIDEGRVNSGVSTEPAPASSAAATPAS